MRRLRRILFGAVLLLLGFEWGGRLDPAQAAPPGPSETRKVQVTDPALARLIAEGGGRLLADYGSAQLFAVEAGGGRRRPLPQFVGPVLPQWYDELARTGVRIVSYIPHGAYLVYGDEASLGRVQALSDRPFVQWDGAFLGEYKVHPAARARAPE